MIFLHEQLLYLLIIPILAFIFSFKKDKKDISSVFSKDIINKLRISSDTPLNGLHYRLLSIISALFIIALARPVIKEEISLKQGLQTSLLIALDISKSMYKTDVYPSRLNLAKQKLNFIVQQNKSMNIGLILFTQDAYSLFPLSDDMDALSYMIKNTDFNSSLGQGSNIFSALQAGELMLSQTKDKNILLLGDGGNSPDMSQELSYLKEKNINLYAINISPNTHKGLETLVQKSGGIYKDFSWGEKDIQTLISHIKNNSKKKQVKEKKINHYTQLFVYPLTLAVLVLFLLFNERLIMVLPTKSTIFIVYTILNIFSMPLQAGLFDFYYHHQANTLYKDKNYQEALKVFKTLDNKDYLSYNLANALYKSGRYEESILEYKKNLDSKKKIKFKILHNIANAYVQLDKLVLAKQYYEKSLQINKNSLSKKNLDEVIKALSKRKKPKTKKDYGMSKKVQLKYGSLADLDYGRDSTYNVQIKNLTLTEEELWLKRLQNMKTPTFLQKMKTDKRSKNASYPW